MTTTAGDLRSRIHAGDRLPGVLVRVPALTLIDMVGDQGYDYVLLDTEHGIDDLRDVAEHLLAARAAGLAVLVRVGEGESANVGRILDLGADGVVVPHVRDAAEAEGATQLVHYPPRGRRGFATYTTVGRWGRVPAREHAARAARAITVVMIECLDGVREAPAILSVPDVDVVFVGPADLGASMDFNVEAVRAAEQRVRRVAAGAGVAVMAIVGSSDQARSALADGVQLVTLNAQALIDRALGAWARDSLPID